MWSRKGDTLILNLSTELVERFSALRIALRRSSSALVLIFALVVSFISWKYYFDQQLVLSYNDAMSHLDISRRVVESLKPGIAQIGSVWLPLPHVLSLVFIWNDSLWHTGLAGSIISGLSFIGSVYFTYRFAHLLTKDRLAGVLAALILGLNPNLIYMQTTPMTESLLIFLFISSCFYLLLWSQTNQYRYLIFSAALTFLATLTRYDGWMLLGQMVLTIFVIGYRLGGWKKAEGSIFLFSTLAVYGIGLWVLWNLLIFHDPLYFLNGPFSAKAQQLAFEAEGRLPSKGDLLYSTYLYLLTAIRNNGIFISVLGLLGFIYFFLKNRLNSLFLAGLLLLSPLVFNVLSLFLGHSIINLDNVSPFTLFNVRYGLMMLPAVAIFTAYLVRRQRFGQLLVLSLLIIQTLFLYKTGDVITIKDGVKGASAHFLEETGRWIGQNAKDGLILMAASSQDSIIFQSGLPMKRFITEGTGDYWYRSLDDPTIFANWVAMHKGDLVYQRLMNNDNFLKKL